MLWEHETDARASLIPPGRRKEEEEEEGEEEDSPTDKGTKKSFCTGSLKERSGTPSSRNSF